MQITFFEKSKKNIYDIDNLFVEQINKLSENNKEIKNNTELKDKNTYTSVELFAGCGGLALGLEQAGIESLGLVELNKHACNTLRFNRPKWNVIEDDIIRVAENPAEHFSEIKNKVDILSGGYPCQAFSYAGKKLGLSDVRGTLFYYYAKILEYLKPKMFIAENVKGLVNHDEGKTLKTMIDVFTEIGYRVQYKVLRAIDFGVAQKRERIFIIGVRNDLDIKFEYPKEYGYTPVLRECLKDVPDSIGAKYPEKKKKVLALVPPGGCWRDLPEEVAKEYMGKSYYSGGGRTGMARRLSWDEPCLTLTCSPGQKQTERCHPDEVRPLTIREAARVQSFPDEWEFQGSMSEVYKQIGNAVPVKLAEAVGKAVVNTLDKIK